MRRLLLLSALLWGSPLLAAPVLWTFQDVYFDDGATLTGSFVFDADSDTAVLIDYRNRPVEDTSGGISASSTPVPDRWIQPFYSDIALVAGSPTEPYEFVTNGIFYGSSGLYAFDYFGAELGYFVSYDNSPAANADPADFQYGIELWSVEACVLQGIFFECSRTLQLEFDGPLTNTGGTVGISGSESAYAWSQFLGFGGDNPDRIIISGSLVATTVVPIPAAVWLFASALFGLGWVRRRPA